MNTLTRKVECALNRRDDSASKRKELEEFERLYDECGDIEPDPFHYSIEKALGLPYHKKGDSSSSRTASGQHPLRPPPQPHPLRPHSRSHPSYSLKPRSSKYSI